MVPYVAAPLSWRSRVTLHLAIISNEQTPYRIHLHQRIVRECPGIRLSSVFTHEFSSSPWQYCDVAAINPVMFGRGESSAAQADPLRVAREWRKGGAITRWMESENVGAVVLLGYNDAARMRILHWCRRRGVPCFLFGDSNIRCDTARGLRALAKRILVSRAVSMCDGVLHCGSLGRQYFLRYGARKERLFPFPYEPDYLGLTAPDSRRIESVRARYGIERGKRHLLYSGRLVKVKRVDLLIRAFAAIAGRRPEWRLVIAGAGPLRNPLESAVPVELGDRVLWTGFIEHPADLASVYHSADILAAPSDYEPWGVVVTEAVAAGLAVVASSVVGAAADVVEDGVNGRIFRCGDGNHLAECLLDLTEPCRTDAAKSAARRVLTRWRAQSDPVDGLRKALGSVNLRAGSPSTAAERTA
jgi:glycosyltransferase involved in cell wall biosynthesis